MSNGGGSNWLSGIRESATKSIVNPVLLAMGIFVGGIVALGTTGHLTLLSGVLLGVPCWAVVGLFIWAYRYNNKNAPYRLQSENFRLNLAQIHYRQGQGTLPPVVVQDIDLAPTPNPGIGQSAAPPVAPTDPPTDPAPQPARPEAAGEQL